MNALLIATSVCVFLIIVANILNWWLERRQKKKGIERMFDD